MKPTVKLFVSSLILMITSVSLVMGQYGENYGNVPENYVAYDKYQKAYKYQFL